VKSKMKEGHRKKVCGFTVLSIVLKQSEKREIEKQRYEQPEEKVTEQKKIMQNV